MDSSVGEITSLPGAASTAGSVENVILGAVKNDPFYTISELKVVVEESLPGTRQNWWDIFKILRKHRLVLRRSRFRYARRFWKRD
ncbi:MAG: hypothetical protein JSV44_10625 [Candidatus Zixiibacteriota bacterium]|nr:MAG: hypothetical protein JSV44_10625 [candidate division Zixibacteria bacterium]